MKSLLPLFPFVAALGLLACQGDDGPVAEDATAPGERSSVTPARAGLPPRQCRRRRSGRPRRRAALPTMAWAGQRRRRQRQLRPARRARPADLRLQRRRRCASPGSIPPPPATTATLELHRRRHRLVAADARGRQARRPGRKRMAGRSARRHGARGGAGLCRAGPGRCHAWRRPGAARCPTSPLADAVLQALRRLRKRAARHVPDRPFA